MNGWARRGGALAAVGVLGIVMAGPASADAPDGGVATVVLREDDTRLAGSDADFAIRLPSGAACPGDSANDDYRVNTYMVPSTVDPATVTFAGNGPEPQSYGDLGTFRMPLFDIDTAGIVSQMTAEANAPGEPGQILGLPFFDFAVYEPGFIPEGTYNLGVACTLGEAVVSYWNAEIAVHLAPEDTPAQIRWELLDADSGGEQGASGVLAAGGGALALLAVVALRRRRPARPTIPSKEPR